jgi:hypothetical protein
MEERGASGSGFRGRFCWSCDNASGDFLGYVGKVAGCSDSASVLLCCLHLGGLCLLAVRALAAVTGAEDYLSAALRQLSVMLSLSPAHSLLLAVHYNETKLAGPTQIKFIGRFIDPHARTLP